MRGLQGRRLHLKINNSHKYRHTACTQFQYDLVFCSFLQGFFRRSIQQNINYKMCVKNENCLIMRMNRNRCQHCRFKKCLSVGMSRDGETSRLFNESFAAVL